MVVTLSWWFLGMHFSMCSENNVKGIEERGRERKGEREGGREV